jgi:hypothetical protein
MKTASQPWDSYSNELAVFLQKNKLINEKKS